MNWLLHYNPILVDGDTVTRYLTGETLGCLETFLLPNFEIRLCSYHSALDAPLVPALYLFWRRSRLSIALSLRLISCI